MARVEVDIDTNSSAEQVRSAVLDFSDSRPGIWSNIDPNTYEVYEVGDSTADIKEGSKFLGKTVWVKEHYDWSTPDEIRWTAVESNILTPGSHVVARIMPGDNGGSRVHVIWDRSGSTLIGKLIVASIKATKGKPLVVYVKKALANMKHE